ncbi:MAG: pyruvate ferredoxin oxidoreductase [Thermoprotei archaeon]|nr:MAG: pyruvate ferredoxin oxidoreductase [Thermoprotei archaeon]
MKSEPKWNEVWMGALVPEPGNSVLNLTGTWRVFRPVMDVEKCVRCLICWSYCPEPAIRIVDKPYRTKQGREYKFTLEIDYDHCKGCGICAQECPVKAIQMVEEVR